MEQPLTDLRLAEVETRRPHPYDHLIGTGDRWLDVDDLEDLRPPVPGESNRFGHGNLLCGPGLR